MNWTPILIPAGLILFFLAVKTRSQISAADALELLKNKTLIIDVRTENEFQAGHLPQAINIPLDEIGINTSQNLPDKSQVLLLHCASGVRSGLAQRKLKGMGYVNVFNLGSFSRAERLLRQQK
jgi:phage shock protein E